MSPILENGAVPGAAPSVAERPGDNRRFLRVLREIFAG
jgi:hypothetical protein